MPLAGYPRVAHIRLTNYKEKTGRLIIEPCPAYKDLFLIHYDGFTDGIRHKIVEIAYSAFKWDNLTITGDFIEEAYRASSRFRWEHPLDREPYLKQLQAENLQAADVLASEETLISCHDFVLSVIHIACSELHRQVPLGLRIYPEHAWSDMLLASARSDDDLLVTHVDRLSPTSYQQMNMFEAEGKRETSETQKQDICFTCLIL